MHGATRSLPAATGFASTSRRRAWDWACSRSASHCRNSRKWPHAMPKRIRGLRRPAGPSKCWHGWAMRPRSPRVRGGRSLARSSRRVDGQGRSGRADLRFLQRDRHRADGVQHFTRERFVVGYAALPHERRVRREAFHESGIARRDHVAHVRAVGVDGNSQIGSHWRPFIE